MLCVLGSGSGDVPSVSKPSSVVPTSVSKKSSVVWSSVSILVDIDTGHLGNKIQSLYVVRAWNVFNFRVLISVRQIVNNR